MNFRLVEEPTKKKVNIEWPPSRKTLNTYDKLETTDEQTQFVNERIFPHKIFKNLYGVQPIIMDSIQKLGLDPKRNFFLQFVSTLNVPMPNATYRPKLQYIYSSFMNKKMDLHMEVLQNPSLYDRSDREFQYTLNAFYMMSDVNKAKMYLKDIRVINIDEFFESGNEPSTSPIKPAGIGGKKGDKKKDDDTIFKVIEKWVSQVGEYSPEEIADKKNREKSMTTIGSVFRSDKHLTYRYLSAIADSYYPEVEVDIEGEALHFMLYTAFSLTNIENIYTNITPRTLVDVKNGTPNEVEKELKSLSYSPQPEIKPGVIINTSNIHNDPVSLYLYYKFIVLSKNNKFVATNLEEMAQSIQDIILNAPMYKPNTQDKSELGKEFVKALADAYKSNNVGDILNNIWQEKIV